MKKKPKATSRTPLQDLPGEIERPEVAEVLSEQMRDVILLAQTQIKAGRSAPAEIKILAVSLFSAGYAKTEIGEICGVSDTTVGYWLRDPSLVGNSSLRRISDKISENIASRLMVGAQTCINHALDPDKLAKARFADLIKGGEVLLKMSRLTDDKSTENVSHLHRHVDDYKEKDAEVTEGILKEEAEILALGDIIDAS
jgi:hypothetical protein